MQKEEQTAPFGFNKKMTEQQTETKRPIIATSLGPNPTIEKEIPEDVEWIDDAFYIKKTRFGINSVLKEPIWVLISSLVLHMMLC